MKAIGEIRKQQHSEARGAKTRQDILQAAVHVASAEGLEGLTIGRLADELRMSKSGLFAHFGSKEELQLAVVGKARDIFVHEVVDPAFTRERGLVRRGYNWSEELRLRTNLPQRFENGSTIER